MAGLLDNMRKRKGRANEALNAARAGRKVNPTKVKVTKPKSKSDEMVRRITQGARKQSPYIAPKRSTQSAPRGLRAAPPSKAPSEVTNKIQQLQKEMAASAKKKAGSFAERRKKRMERASRVTIRD
ncbi:MAG: hypothetical protein DRI46_06820 [Chloroflexi bacterium]|nr:MAG: hypothetical protein DRI46_06820 [Chloroflexota bacterium]